MQEFQTAYIATATTTNIVAANKNLKIHSVVVPKATAGTVTFNDRTGSPVTYFTFPASTVGATYIFDSVFPNGLSVITASADIIIVNYATY